MATKGVFFLDRNRQLVPVTWLEYNETDGDVKIADETILAAEIDDGSITADKIAAKTLTHSQLADDAGILGTQIADDTISHENIGDGEITNEEIAAKTITYAQIADETLTASQLADNTVTPGKMSAGVPKVLSAHVSYNDGKSTVAKIGIPANALVTDVIAVCTETFNGTSVTLTIGDDAYTDGFLADAHIGKTAGNVSGEDPANRGSLLWVDGQQDGLEDVTSWGRKKQKFYTDGTLHLCSTLGYTGTSKGTTGAITIYLVYVALA
jgi:hypothetical protein